MYRTFKLIDTDYDNKQLGTFSMSEDGKKLQVELVDGLSWLTEIPVEFYPGYLSGQRKFETEDVLYWMEDRVAPPYRQNIEDVLRAMNLSEYSMLGIFLNSRGQSANDRICIDDGSGAEHYHL